MGRMEVGAREPSDDTYVCYLLPRYSISYSPPAAVKVSHTPVPYSTLIIYQRTPKMEKFDKPNPPNRDS